MRNYLFILPLAAALAGCGEEHESGAADQAGRAMQARTALLDAQRMPEHHVTPAVVVAEERVELASRLMGYLRDITVAEGQAVQRGARLFTVDPVDVAGQVDQARLAVKQSEDALRDANADFQRYANLFKEEVVSRQHYEKMQLQRDMAETHLAQAKAGLATATGQLRYAAVDSPMNGVVVRKLADNGDLAAPGQAVLVVENPASLQVETQVPESLQRHIRLGQALQVEVDGAEQPMTAQVARISPAADPVSHTFMVRLAVDGKGLRSGAFARCFFPVGERLSLLVPAAALVNRAGIDGVFVVDADGLARFRMVRTGRSLPEGVEIQAGLQAGERIVVEGAAALRNGDKVTG